MHTAYPNLFSPIRIGNHVLQSRFNASISAAWSSQGPEEYPAESTIRHYLNKARHGTGYVVAGPMGFPPAAPPLRIRGRHPRNMAGHWANFDIADSQVQNYLAQLADGLHLLGSKAGWWIDVAIDEPYDVDDGIAGFELEGVGDDPRPQQPTRRIPYELMEKLAEDLALQSAILQDCGFDLVYLHASYRATLLARFLSRRTNSRDDEFGGSVENRCRLHKLVCDRIRERCGRDLLIKLSVTGLDLEEQGQEWTLEDTAELARQMDGYADILQIRGHHIDYAHNLGFDAPTPNLEASEAAKKSGSGVAIACVNGFVSPEVAEAALRDGKADMIDMARAFISNPDWGDLVRAGRGQDIVPCIKCSKCHRNSYREPAIAACSVNPTWSQEHRIDFLARPARERVSIAVAGGGPAGMRAALFAAERGHRVTLFEQSDSLGGLLRISRHVPSKWPLRDYLDYLISHVRRDPNIDLCLNTSATREMLEQGGFDEVITAIGGEVSRPPIPGADGPSVVDAKDIFGNEQAVGDDVVIIGGGEVGVDCGLHLAAMGRKVFVVEMLSDLMLDAPPLHYRARFVEAWQKEPDFDYVCGATCTSIREDGVTYRREDGGEESVKADTVLIATGLRPRLDDALALYRPGMQPRLIGDCNKVGNVQTCNRDALRAVLTV